MRVKHLAPNTATVGVYELILISMYVPSFSLKLHLDLILCLPSFFHIKQTPELLPFHDKEITAS